MTASETEREKPPLRMWKGIVGACIVLGGIAAFFGIVAGVKSCSGDHTMEAKGEVHPFVYPPAFSAEEKVLRELAKPYWPDPAVPWPPSHGCLIERKGKIVPCPVDPLRQKLDASNFGSGLRQIAYASMGTVEVKNTGKALTDARLVLPLKGEYLVKLVDGEKDAAFEGSIPLGTLLSGAALKVTWWGGPTSASSLEGDARLVSNEGSVKVAFSEDFPWIQWVMRGMVLAACMILTGSWMYEKGARAQARAEALHRQKQKGQDPRRRS